MESLVFKRSVLKPVNITPTPISSLHGGTNHYNWKCIANWVVFVYFFFFHSSSWFAGCWACRRTLSFVPVGRWLAEGRKKLSTLFEFRRKQRERRSTYSDGQTYDLPKNGNL